MMRVALFLTLFLGVASAAIWTAALAFETAQTTRVSYKYIASALTASPQKERAVVWKRPDQELVRPFTEADAVVIGQALQEAWQVHAVAQDSGNPDLIADRFTGVAEERAALSVADAKAHGGRMVVLSQEVTPRFYHKDGSVFQAKVQMVVARFVSSDGVGLDAMRVTKDSGIATLLNESNGWRLMSWERRESEPVGETRSTFQGGLYGVNYYPSKTPWRDFWPAFDAKEIASDFDQIAGLNANSVRIFLTRDAFLGENANDALRSLETLLKIAAEKNLEVVPTLFDLKQDFSLGTWADDAQYLSKVLPILAAAPAVAFVDLKNEPDLDFEAHGIAKMMAWLQSMLALSRDWAPNLSMSIGWSSAEAAENLVSDLDVITYHDYASLDDTYDRLALLSGKTDGKPIYVTEIGDSTFNLGAGFPGSEKKQAQRLSVRLQALSAADGAMVWTLYDFPSVDASVVGGSPWVKRLQSSFGILRIDGGEKPAAAILRAEFKVKN